MLVLKKIHVQALGDLNRNKKIKLLKYREISSVKLCTESRATENYTVSTALLHI